MLNYAKTIWCSRGNICLVLLISFVLLNIYQINCQTTSTCPEVFKKLKDHIEGLSQKFCSSIKCQANLTQKDCPSGTVLEKEVSMCDCCPGCVKYKNGYEDDCDDSEEEVEYEECDSLICPIVKECKPGLSCQSGKCLPKATPNCENLCFIKRSLIEKENEVFKPIQRRSLPSCTNDGKFEPKQCKGTKNDGDCFCVDECGKRIFGRALYRDAANMTCGCSRLVHDLRTNKNRLATLHCTEKGDFEPLQCDTDSALCYCVDPITGESSGEVVGEHLWRTLPCYKSENYGENGNYLRVCESEWVATEKISRDASLHGLSFSGSNLKCDFDGGFGPSVTDSFIIQDRCVHKGGAQIGAYFRQSRKLPPMDCQCARDSIYKPSQGIPFPIECDGKGTNGDVGPGPGSYKLFYSAGNFSYCVDTDGYQFGPDVPEAFKCCIDPEGCPNNLLTNCKDDEKEYEYKKCLDYTMGRE